MGTNDHWLGSSWAGQVVAAPLLPGVGVGVGDGPAGPAASGLTGCPMAQRGGQHLDTGPWWVWLGGWAARWPQGSPFS